MNISNLIRSTVSPSFRRAKRAEQRQKDFRSQVPEITSLEEDLINAVSPYTMTGKLRRFALTRALDYLNRAKIEGDIVECGVWRGGNIFLSRMFQEAAFPSVRRRYYLFDTFDGMSEPTPVDIGSGGSALDQYNIVANNWCRATIEDVLASATTFFDDLSPMHFVAGKVEDTLLQPDNIPESISLLRLDTDWYESTKIELEVLYPRLSSRGVLIIDDYGSWQGARLAVDEYFSDKPVLLQRIDSTSRLVIKS